MKIAKVFTALAISAMMAGPLLADNVDLPRVQIEGKTYYYYEVKKDDSLYGISKRFGWSIDRLKDVNPQTVMNLKKGDRLYYPATDASSSVKHFVTKGETLYGISMRYGVPTDVLYQANPQLKNGLKAGTTIIIPQVEAQSAQEPQEIIPSQIAAVAKNDPVAEALPLQEEVIALPDSVAVENSQSEVVEQAAPIDELSVIGLQQQPVERQHPETVKVAVVMEQPKAKRDLEFIRGILTGIDDLKTASYKISFKVLSGQTPGLTDSLKVYHPNLLVSTAESIPENLATFADNNDCQLINVFDVKSKLFESHPNTVQLMVPSDYFNTEAAEYIADKFRGGTLLIVGQPDPNDQICEKIKDSFTPAKSHILSLADLANFRLNDGDTYVIYSASAKRADAEELLKSVNNMAASTVFSTFAVIGRPNWVLFDNELQNIQPKVDFYIPSRYYFDYTSEDSKNFEEHFRKMYGKTPQKSFPIYAVEGYDFAKYFIPAYYATCGDLLQSVPEITTLQNNINLQSPEEVAGKVNNGVFMLRYIGGSRERERISVK